MAQMYYSQRIARKAFRGTNVKDAYMKAVKWYASNIIAKDELHNVQVEYTKHKSEPVVIMSLYAVMSESEVIEQHCSICKEMHHSFFINEDTQCNRCSAMGYQKRLERKIITKVSYYKGLLSKIQNEGEGSDEQDVQYD